MLALTVGGQAGSGGPEIGYVLAGGLNARYVRHLAVRRLARRLNATVDAVSRKELSFASRWQRLAAAAESAFLRMGYYGYDPTGGMALSRAALDVPEVRTSPGDISDREYIDAVYATAAQFAREGDVVLVKRAGSLTLRRFPEVVHLGLFASRDARVARMARRLSVGMADAADALLSLERARKAWFRRLGGDDPEDPALYDIRLHTDLGETDGRVAVRAIEMLRDLKPGISFSALGLRPSPLVEEHPAVA